MDTNKIVMIAPVAVAGILMLAVLAAMSSTNQALAAEKKRTELTISATQTGPAKNEANETKENVKFSGRLTSEGSGVAGATIAIECDGRECRSADTDNGGHYSVGAELPDHGTKYEIEALTEHIPSDYENSNATTTIQLR